MAIYQLGNGKAMIDRFMEGGGSADVVADAPSSPEGEDSISDDEVRRHAQQVADELRYGLPLSIDNTGRRGELPGGSLTPEELSRRIASAVVRPEVE